jgi:carbonic anhydrase/acetyltransferase-like protein (isoleucine patch superfamily)
MNIRPYLEHAPRLGARVFVDPTAVLIGAVEVGADASLWPLAVVRGDVNHIVIGARSNIQDGAIVHVTHDGPFGPPGGLPCLIGSDVTVGHGAILHACTIEDTVLIGMGARVLDGARVKRHGYVGAGALVPPGKVVGEAELWVGSPARCVRRLSDRQIEQLHYSAQHYVRLKDRYLAMAAAG